MKDKYKWIFMIVFLSLYVFLFLGSISWDKKRNCRIAVEQGGQVVWLDTHTIFDNYCEVRQEINGDVVGMESTDWLRYFTEFYK